MSWLAAIADLRRELTTHVEQRLLRVFGWTLSAHSSALGDADAVELEDGAKGQRTVRRVEPWGHRGRPPSKVRTFQIRIGSSNVVFLGIASNKGYGRSDLDEGDTQLYCSAPGTEVVLKAGGDGELNAGDTGTWSVNGGTAKVARLGDSVDRFTAFTTWMGNVEAALSALGHPVAALIGTRIGTVSSGADRFKA